MSLDLPGSALFESAACLPVDLRRLPWIPRLAADYAYNFRLVSSFFAGDPGSPHDWTDRITRTHAHSRHCKEMASVVAAQQDRRHAPRRAREAGQRLADRNTVAVVTGQQAALFGGPVFTLLKSLTALKLAERISRDHGVPAVAVFWVEAEDHDWEEVRSCSILDPELDVRTIGLAARPASDPVPVARIVLDLSIREVLDDLARVLPVTDFTPALLADLREVYAPGTGMADAFCVWLERALGDRGLVVYDASDPAAKPLVADVFARELSTAGRTTSLARAAGSDLESRGYHAQVQPLDSSLALFRLDGARRAIRQEEGKLVVGGTSYPPSALVQEVLSDPARFSPGVLLRPVVQDTLFPTVCYVAGPSELAYLGQLRGVYQHFDVPMPLIYPRATATLLDSASSRFLARYHLSLETLQPQDEAALNALLQQQIPAGIEQAVAAASGAVDTHMTALTSAVSALDSTLEGAVQSTLGRMQHDLRTLHGKIIQSAKRRHDTLRRQFTHARALAFPRGHAQERAIGFVSFLNRYGSALVDRLDDELPLDMGRHWVVTI